MENDIGQRVAAAINAALEKEEVDEREQIERAKLTRQNTKGEVLLCKITLAKKQFAPDPLSVVVNEEIRWLRRGHEQIVPWYVVVHMLGNIERKFHQERSEDGKHFVVVAEDMPSEAFNYTMIDPAPGVTLEKAQPYEESPRFKLEEAARIAAAAEAKTEKSKQKAAA